jgi:hypothetical protein
MQRVFTALVWVLQCFPWSLPFSSEAAVLRASLRHSSSKEVASSHIQTRSSASEDEAFDEFLEEWFSDFTARKPMEALRFGKPLLSCKGLSQKHDGRVDNIWGNSTSAAKQMVFVKTSGGCTECTSASMHQLDLVVFRTKGMSASL